jgi:putative membrane protein
MERINKRINRILSVMVCIALSVGVMSCGQRKAEDSKDMAEDSNESKFKNTGLKDDNDFAIDAADGGMLEVKLGELAQTNGSLDAVKKFGKAMVDDHSKANKELQELANRKNITIPLSLSDKNQKHYDDLSKKSGKEFDEAYTDFMVNDHKEDVEAFKKEAEKGNDQDLRSWAAGKLSTLEHHLQMAKEAEQACKNNNSK